jgi:3-phytase
VLATAKDADALLVLDAATGRELRRAGSEGAAPGQFDRPNGVAVAGDLAVVVERDNARAQLLRLPDLAPLAAFGEGDLERPYGVALEALGGGVLRAWITDNYTGRFGAPLFDDALGERVRQYRIDVSGAAPLVTLEVTFGETAGPGVIRVAESVQRDAGLDRLYLAEEDPRASAVHVYDGAGRYAGRSIATSFFPDQAEGIALYACADGSGYLVATNQAPTTSHFHVFDRRSLAYLGSFRGAVTANTDGIALEGAPVGPFARGAFFAVHDDQAVSAFDWGAVLDALGLEACAP